MQDSGWEREGERELTQNIQNAKEKHERFTAHYIPRSPMARAHRTVKRPEKINHRIKLPTEKRKRTLGKHLNN